MRSTLSPVIIFTLFLMLFYSCAAKGDIYPEIDPLDLAIEKSKHFTIENVFTDGEIRDIALLNEFLFVNITYATWDSIDHNFYIDSIRCEVLKDGKLHSSIPIPYPFRLKQFQIDKEENVYLANRILYAPDYTKSDTLKIVSAEKKEASFILLEKILKGKSLDFTKEDYLKIDDDITDFSNIDSLNNELMNYYEGDTSAMDSLYRKYIYFFYKYADYDISSKGPKVIHIDNMAYYWDYYAEHRSIRDLTDGYGFIEKSYSGFFKPNQAESWGDLKYNNEQLNITATLFDKSIEEWDADCIGAPHIGIGLCIPDAIRIWYYNISMKNKTLKFKVMESMRDDREPFNYITSKNEIYFYSFQDGTLERILPKD